jgi:hypothetical protein
VTLSGTNTAVRESIAACQPNQRAAGQCCQKNQRSGFVGLWNCGRGRYDEPRADEDGEVSVLRTLIGEYESDKRPTGEPRETTSEGL